MDRKRLIIIASVLAFAVILWWGSTLLSLPERQLVTGRPTTPDYAIEGMHVTQMDSSGRKKFELRAAHLIHYPRENLARLQDVFLIQYEPGGIRIDTRADTARYPDHGKEILMQKNVHIVRKRDGRIIGDIRAEETHITLKK